MAGDEKLTAMKAKQEPQSYMLSQLFIANERDKALKRRALQSMITDNYIKNFIIYDVLDRLTYTRDYDIRKSINFMVMSKTLDGEVVGVAHYVYLKSSNLLYLKKYRVAGDANFEEVSRVLIEGGRGVMMDYGYRPKAVVASPSIKEEGGMEEVNSLRRQGLRFMSLRPSTKGSMDVISSAYSKFDQHFLEGRKKEISVFPLKGKGGVSDMRVILMRPYGNEKLGMDKKAFSSFLIDLKNEDDLSRLLMIFEDTEFKVVAEKVDSAEKLMGLFGTLCKKTGYGSPESK